MFLHCILYCSCNILCLIYKVVFICLIRFISESSMTPTRHTIENSWRILNSLVNKLIWQSPTPDQTHCPAFKVMKTHLSEKSTKLGSDRKAKSKKQRKKVNTNNLPCITWKKIVTCTVTLNNKVRGSSILVPICWSVWIKGNLLWRCTRTRQLPYFSRPSIGEEALAVLQTAGFLYISTPGQTFFRWYGEGVEVVNSWVGLCMRLTFANIFLTIRIRWGNVSSMAPVHIRK